MYIQDYKNYLDFSQASVLLILESEQGQVVRHQWDGCGCNCLEVKGVVLPIADTDGKLSALLERIPETIYGELEEADKIAAQISELLGVPAHLIKPQGEALAKIEPNGWLCCENSD